MVSGAIAALRPYNIQKYILSCVSGNQNGKISLSLLYILYLFGECEIPLYSVDVQYNFQSIYLYIFLLK